MSGGDLSLFPIRSRSNGGTHGSTSTPIGQETWVSKTFCVVSHSYSTAMARVRIPAAFGAPGRWLYDKMRPLSGWTSLPQKKRKNSPWNVGPQTGS